MATISVSCPACNEKLQAPETIIGKKAKCPHCQQGFVVPQEEVVTAALAPLSPPPKRLPPPPPPPKKASRAQPLTPPPGAVAEGTVNPFAGIGEPPPPPQNDNPFAGFSESPAESNPFASPGSSTYGRQQETYQEKVDSRWYSVSVGLKITETAALILCGGLLLMMIGLFGGGGPIFLPGSGFLGFLTPWGGIAILCGFAVVTTGWVVCLATPPQSRANAMASGAVAASLGTVALLFVMTLILSAGPARSIEDMKTTQTITKIFFTLAEIALVGGFALFALYLSGLAKYAENYSLPQQCMFYVIYAGAYGLFNTLVLHGVFQVTSLEGVRILMVSTISMGILLCGGLWYLCNQTKQIVLREVLR